MINSLTFLFTAIIECFFGEKISPYVIIGIIFIIFGITIINLS